MSWLFNTFIFIPLYNGFVLLIDIIPYHLAGIAVIVLTIFVKFALLPLALKMAHTQKRMKEITPQIEAIKEKHKNNRQKMTLETMELYKRENIKPFVSFLILLIQLPVIIGLYFVFVRTGFPEVRADLLYSFIKAPEFVNSHFFGINLTGKSVVLASVVGITQYIYATMTVKDIKFAKDDEKDTFKADLQKSMQLQMKYFLPVIMAFISYTLSAAIALYFIVSNIFMIGQEYYFRYKGVK